MLILRMDVKTAFQVGRLGRFTFQRGYCAYAGSALGTGGLAGRLGHHLRLTGKPHWHIDYLKRHAKAVEIWFAENDQRQECRFAGALAKITDAAVAAAGFGASDCGCCTHLYHFTRRPQIGAFHRQLRQTAGGIEAFRISVRSLLIPDVPKK